MYSKFFWVTISMSICNSYPRTEFIRASSPLSISELSQHEIANKSPQEIYCFRPLTGARNISFKCSWNTGQGFTGLVLLGAGADIEARDMFVQTVLHMESIHGNIHGVRFFVSRDADVFAQTSNESNALHVVWKNFATNSDGWRVVEFRLDRGVDVMGVDSDGCTPLHIACQRGNIALAKLLLTKGANSNAQDNEGRTPLHDSLLHGRLERRSSFKAVPSLMEFGSDVNIQDNQGCTALHYAATHVIDTEFPYTSELILDHGADINFQDANGQTPLFRSFSRCEDFNSTKLLMERGADVNISNSEGDTILHKGRDRNLKLLKILLHRRGNISALNKKGDSPLASVLMRSREARLVADMLILWGAKEIRSGQEQATS
ncbi:ankyrin repeat-containing domain protein [Fusarium oxysporum f. sp. albedinis]|nr:ankyrin repeat-containing domain protein [Fusarium oxysporum f. sp. albedinis]